MSGTTNSVHMIIKCVHLRLHCCWGTPLGAEDHVQASNKPLGTSTPMDSAQVVIVLPSAYRGPPNAERREGGSIWIHAVFRRPHGFCCFSMIRTARPSAMMVMRQRYNDHFRSSRAPIRCHRRSEKVGCHGFLCKSVTTHERGAGSNRLPFLKAHP